MTDEIRRQTPCGDFLNSPQWDELQCTRPGRNLVGASNSPKAFKINKNMFQSSGTPNSRSAAIKAAETNPVPKVNSIVCSDCDGNGAVACSQCKGHGVNSVDHFNGQFKAGGLCWLCRGKKDILCGNCNGAGFMGGFMSTCDS
ncbi:hypothetical protein GIB67_037391 [Kingdonia uniflora]|uniref:BSD2 cysteine rich domain-containing protein n=1 Tax=Kingdonia uniflora TaxID=39325 RepID=A0A7J7M8I3_9MAGN|nr:hypothetical protein GIB67_037391 [Kingdonia uniflora]